jgi:Cu/Ag efflux pump CusA
MAPYRDPHTRGSRQFSTELILRCRPRVGSFAHGVTDRLIALLGVDAETGVFMLRYLDFAYEKASREGRLRTLADLQGAIVEPAAKRLRPKFMTVATMFVGLIPIMWAARRERKIDR